MEFHRRAPRVSRIEHLTNEETRERTEVTKTVFQNTEAISWYGTDTSIEWDYEEYLRKSFQRRRNVMRARNFA